MVSVASLLNPVPLDLSSHCPSPNPHQSKKIQQPNERAAKKQKMSKDAAVFAKGRIKGENRFPPFEITDEELLEQHRWFHIFPQSEIQSYPRHIPYNSDKKSFLEKTGRESFEVFQYTFKIPGDEREYTVMWDYNIGLVRITPFFKCRKYSKTTPAKMLNANPGLRDICHSITGGALAAQGYWMPYECAKAIAATFCYPIRHALTPIFGPEFPALCTPPDDPCFGRMIIDAEIVHYCTLKASEFRDLEERSRDDYLSESLECPTSTTEYKRFWATRQEGRLLRPKIKKCDIESGYGTDTDQSEMCSISPSLPPRTTMTRGWTCANTSPPRSSPNYSTSSPRTRRKRQLYEPKAWLSSVPCLKREEGAKRDFEEFTEEDFDDDSAEDTIGEEVEEENKEREAEEKEEEDREKKEKEEWSGWLSKEARAAYLLMQLHAKDKELGDGHGNKRRRRASN